MQTLITSGNEEITIIGKEAVVVEEGEAAKIVITDEKVTFKGAEVMGSEPWPVSLPGKPLAFE